LKTKNSLSEEQLRPFHAEYVGLDIDAGRYLARCGLKTIGVDYLSVEDQSPDVVHQAILGAGIGPGRAVFKGCAGRRLFSVRGAAEGGRRRGRAMPGDFGGFQA
jgi:hypothetical protein